MSLLRLITFRQQGDVEPSLGITTQPQNVIVAETIGSASFSVSASDPLAGNLSYQWEVSSDGGSTYSQISGETSTTLSLSSLTNTTDNNKKFRCVVSTDSGLDPVTSSSANLRVISPTEVANVFTTFSTGTLTDDIRHTDITWSPDLSKFVMVADANLTGQSCLRRAHTSSDGDSWSIVTMPACSLFQRVIWVKELGIFCAVAANGSPTQVYTSTNGTSWTARSTPLNQAWRGVAWSPELELFVAVSSSGTTQQAMTSPDGITWTARTTPATASWFDVIWVSELELFIASANGGGTSTQRIMTSPDGENWTIRTHSSATTPYGLVWSPELQLLVVTGFGRNFLTSTDGTSFTFRQMPSTIATGGMFNPVWAKELGVFFVVGSASNGTQEWAYSSNGTSWTELTPANASHSRGLAWSSELGIFVVSTYATSSNSVMYSTSPY